MEVNTSKTKLLNMSFHPPAASATSEYISIDGAPVETVEQFNYLGSPVTANCDLDAEINHRLQCASHAFFKLRERVFGSSDLTIRTKVLVFKAVVLSILLYGSECWIVYKKHVKALEKFQTRLLRSIMRIKWQNFITNKEIRERANCETIENTLARNQLLWLGHVCRMSDGRLPKQILFGELSSHTWSTIFWWPTEEIQRYHSFTP